MDRLVNVITLAVRVLDFYVAKRLPDAVATEALEAVAGPKPSHLQWDEYACSVIQEAIARR